MKSEGELLSLNKSALKKLLEEPIINYANYDELMNRKLAGENIIFLDIRLPVEIPKDERDNRLIIPLPTMRSHFKSLKRDTTYVVYSDGGGHASLGTYLLSQAGFDAVLLVGPK